MLNSTICVKHSHILKQLNYTLSRVQNVSVKKSQISGIVLAIDDDEYCRLMLKLVLQSLHYDAVVLSSVEEGKQYLHQHSKDIALILSDIDLPGISGLEFLREIKQHPIFHKIPIILQTGDGILRKEEALTLGASGFLEKPYTREALYKAISRVNLQRDKQQ